MQTVEASATHHSCDQLLEKMMGVFFRHSHVSFWSEDKKRTLKRCQTSSEAFFVVG